jgi:ribonucleoside-diphosphate reductase alpha chain
MTNTARQRLPNRRGHELLSFEHSGVRYTAGIGRFDDGRLAEIFLNAPKCGTDLDVGVRDAAIVASLALQAGISAAVIRHALTSNRDGSACGPLGRILDLLVEG